MSLKSSRPILAANNNVNFFGAIIFSSSWVKYCLGVGGPHLHFMNKPYLYLFSCRYTGELNKTSAKKVVLFVLAALGNLATAKGSVLSMWALDPSIFNLLQQHSGKNYSNAFGNFASLLLSLPVCLREIFNPPRRKVVLSHIILEVQLLHLLRIS